MQTVAGTAGDGKSSQVRCTALRNAVAFFLREQSETENAREKSGAESGE